MVIYVQDIEAIKNAPVPTEAKIASLELLLKGAQEDVKALKKAIKELVDMYEIETDNAVKGQKKLVEE